MSRTNLFAAYSVCLVAALPQLVAGQAPWTTTAAFLTPVTAGNATAPMALGAGGDIYIAAQAGATQPTGKFGDVSTGWTWISRVSASGIPLFADWIGGARVATALGLAANGNALIAGQSYASGLPATAGAWAPVSSGDSTAFVCEIAAADGTPVFCTYLKSAVGFITSIGADAAGDVYMLANAVQGAPMGTPGALALGNRALLMKLNPTGSVMLWIAELGGEPAALAVDAAGDVYLTGTAAAADFPGATGAGPGLFVAKVDPSGSKLIFAAFPPGEASDIPEAMAVDASGAIYATGVSLITPASVSSRFAAKYSSGDGQAIYRTALPVSGMALASSNGATAFETGAVKGIAVDADGNAIVVGLSEALTPHLLTATCRQANLKYPVFGALEAFMVRLGPDGSLLQSTYIGTGTAPVYAYGVTAAGSQAYVAVIAADFGSAGVLRVGPDATGNSVTSIGCMENAAGFAAGTLAPGEIFSIFGEGLGPMAGSVVPLGTDGLFPSQYSGVQVAFDDVAAPLLYIQDGQINAITPWALAGKTSSQMCVAYGGRTSCTTAALGPAAPGFFIVHPDPDYPAVAVNQDGSLNSGSNPAHVGSIVTIYGTGLGPLSPMPVDGGLTQLPVPAMADTVQARVQRPAAGPGFGTVDAAADIVFAGPAPLEVAGLFQINVRIPGVDAGSNPVFTLTVEVQLPDGTTVTTGNSIFIAPQ